jgi:hypothetical protein
MQLELNTMKDHFHTFGGPLILCSIDAMAFWPGAEEAPEILADCHDWISPVRFKNNDYYIFKGAQDTVSCTWRPNPITKGGLLWRCITAPDNYTVPKNFNIYGQGPQISGTLIDRSEKKHFAVFDGMFTAEEARFAEAFVEMIFPIYFRSLDTYEYRPEPDVHFIIHNFRPLSPVLQESVLTPARPKILV